MKWCRKTIIRLKHITHMKLFTLIFRSVTSIELLRTSYLTENAPLLIKSTKIRKLYKVIIAMCDEYHTTSVLSLGVAK